MASHVSQCMRRKMHVGQMANHVSTCMEHGMSIKWDGNQFVVRESNKKERKEKIKNKKEKEKKGRQKEGGKEIGVPIVETRWTKK